MSRRGPDRHDRRHRTFLDEPQGRAGFCIPTARCPSATLKGGFRRGCCTTPTYGRTRPWEVPFRPPRTFGSDRRTNGPFHRREADQATEAAKLRSRSHLSPLPAAFRSSSRAARSRLQSWTLGRRLVGILGPLERLPQRRPPLPLVARIAARSTFPGGANSLCMASPAMPVRTAVLHPQQIQLYCTWHHPTLVRSRTTRRVCHPPTC